MKRDDLPLPSLDDYLYGVTPDAEAAELEEQLFALAQDGAATSADFLAALQRKLTWLEVRHQFGEMQPRAYVDQLRASGARVHYLEVEGRGSIEIPIWQPNVDRVIVRLGLDLRGYEHVELDASLLDGTEVIKFRDVAYDRTDGCIYAVCMEPVARMAFNSGPLHWRVSGQRDGRRALVAEYDTRPA